MHTIFIILYLLWNITQGVVLASYDHHMIVEEKNHGIPPRLLKAISWVESGRVINKSTVAWPWTINVDGKGYIFKTKNEAIQATRQFQKNGKSSIDVGLMQVNLKHHPHAFQNLEQAFDPKVNIAYAAKFLKELFLKTKSWSKAVGYYHSTTPKYYQIYRKKVLSSWNILCKSSQGIPPGNSLSDAPLQFHDVRNATSITPYAKAKKRYYSLERCSAHGGAGCSDAKRAVMPAGRLYYTLD